jgi:outer membrane protein assembly factor BamB
VVWKKKKVRGSSKLFRNLVLYLVASLWMAPALVVADWPQFQGPTRDSHSPETGLLKQWPDLGPELVWTYRQTGLGYSSPAVSNGKLFISGAQGEQEQLQCIDLAIGKLLWQVPVGPKFDFQGNTWGVGPRATASVAEGRVFALGGGGNLICVEESSGKLLWQKHMMKDLGGQVNPIGGGPGSKPDEEKIGWGYSWSPLVDGQKLICFPGGGQGAVAAVKVADGSVIWRSTGLTAMASYASPIVAQQDGQRQYVVIHNSGLAAVSSDDGRLLWSWEKEYPDVVIPTPIAVQDHIYASAGNNPSTVALLKVSKSANDFKVEQLYKSKAVRVMKNLVGGSVIVGDHAYGYSDKVGWVCQKVMTGDQAWAARSPLKAGSVIAADGMLYCYDEDNAEVALVEANPEKFVLKSKFKLPESTAFKAPGGRNWTPPVISDGRLLIRDQELLFCFKIKQ